MAAPTAVVSQSLLLPLNATRRTVWAVTVAVSWALGWIVTASVIVDLDLDRGHAMFGSSGAAVVTILTGIVVRLVLGRPRRAAADDGGDGAQIAAPAAKEA
jgi:hypothetical protein